MPFTNQSEIDALALRSGDRRKPASSGHDRRGFRSGLILGAALCAGAAIALPAIITHPDRSITHEVAKSMGARDAKNATAPSKASEQRPAPEAKVAAPAPPAKPDAHAPGDPPEIFYRSGAI